jgi:hypothetical protein
MLRKKRICKKVRNHRTHNIVVEISSICCSYLIENALELLELHHGDNGVVLFVREINQRQMLRRKKKGGESLT